MDLPLQMKSFHTNCFCFKALKDLEDTAENMTMKTASILFYSTLVILFVSINAMYSLMCNGCCIFAFGRSRSRKYIRRLEEILNVIFKIITLQIILIQSLFKIIHA